MRFDLSTYTPVEERIGMFYSDHPEGAIRTTIERLDPPLVVFRAEIYRDKNDALPWATGYAYEKEGAGHVNQTSYVENCETSAIGRALANAGYHGRRADAPRPSREEMQKVERMGGSPARPQAAPGTFDLSEPVPFGKHKGRAWADLVETEPAYVEWAVEKMDRLSPAAKQVLAAALAIHAEPANVETHTPRTGVPLTESDDRLPFA